MRAVRRRPPRLEPGLVLAIAFAVTPAVPRAAAALPIVSCQDLRVKELDFGTRALTIKVFLSTPAPAAASVAYVTEDGSATVADGDYETAAGVLEFPPGAEVATLYVTVRGDTKLEGNEWFRVRWSDPVGVELPDPEIVVTLVNDEHTTFSTIPPIAPPYTEGNLPCAWGDYDGDGTPDLPLYNVQPYGAMFEIPGFRALLDQGNYHGGSWCDFDRDGDLDFVILGYEGVEGGIAQTPSLLLRNDGAAGFTNVAPALGMNVIGSGETPTWADFDGDGWPDLFTPYYSHVEPFQSFLYRNNGNGTFTERSVAAGVSMPGIPGPLRPEGAHAADWNDDGHTDLYCASHLFVNDGTGTFTDVRAAVGLPVQFDEGAEFVDIDNDGDLDLYLRSLSGPLLFRNDAGHFIDVTTAAGLGPVPSFWGDNWADADGDGDMDLLLVLGTGVTRLMLNQGDGTFEPDTAFQQLGIAADFCAWADFDQDGDVDFALGGNGPIKQLYRNELELEPGFPHSHLSVRVLDAQGRMTACGATIRLHEKGGPPGTTQTRVVDGGSGYLCQNEYIAHFGGLGSGRYALEVVYPSPSGSRVVVDSLADPVLGSLEPSSMSQGMITVYRDGRVALSGAQDVAGVPGHELAPRIARLGAPTPSPARQWVTLPVDIAGAGTVAIDVHDLGGRLTRRLEAGDLGPGPHAVRWDLRDAHGAVAAPGIYFCRLMVDGRLADARRLVVLR